MRLILLLAFSALAVTAEAQFVLRLQVDEGIPGVCDDQEVYLLRHPKEKPKSPITIKELEARLNSDLQYLKDNPQHRDKGMIGVVINCNGTLVQSKMGNKTKVPELDRQIEAVFATLKTWTPGTLDHRRVDSAQLFTFKIKKGKLNIKYPFK